ncbi:hypothetical protein DL89DRAFT_263068 [Linderina pennispora]|uniref:Uncharacterized protein n=1 Tax=Linderina pennispora TaxID=61395 RepID=A0A1Y1VRA9_9FUNG|nr:uncharacterized protein DL89DRAFT_263068 [Linderina pennispora]ORX63800.1 hypothetical protein DL89DRAFT_263068 [Linderina pennispora]
MNSVPASSKNGSTCLVHRTTGNPAPVPQLLLSSLWLQLHCQAMLCLHLSPSLFIVNTARVRAGAGVETFHFALNHANFNENTMYTNNISANQANDVFDSNTNFISGYLSSQDHTNIQK